MKKLMIFSLVVLMSMALIMPAIAELAVKIPKADMEAALAAKDPGPLLEKYLVPLLESNDQAAMLFCAELNISNGSPFIRNLEQGWGERAMFGKLIDAGMVMKNAGGIRDWMLADGNLAIVKAEAVRLLFGPWKREGKTAFNFASRENLKVLDYETGKWSRRKNVLTIRIYHWTEYYGEQRVAHIACDYKKLHDGAYYLATFGVVR